MKGYEDLPNIGHHELLAKIGENGTLYRSGKLDIVFGGLVNENPPGIPEFVSPIGEYFETSELVMRMKINHDDAISFPGEGTFRVRYE